MEEKGKFQKLHRVTINSKKEVGIIILISKPNLRKVTLKLNKMKEINFIQVRSITKELNNPNIKAQFMHSKLLKINMEREEEQKLNLHMI